MSFAVRATHRDLTISAFRHSQGIYRVIAEPQWIWHQPFVFHDRWAGKQMRGGNPMFAILSFVRKWKQWYRVLRYRKGLALLDSVRYGFCLAHS